MGVNFQDFEKKVPHKISVMSFGAPENVQNGKIGVFGHRCQLPNNVCGLFFTGN